MNRRRPFHLKSENRNLKSRRGFTIMELLVVISILALLAAMSMLALYGAAEQAREQRTRAIINKIDQVIREKYDSYRTRPLPIRVPAVVSGVPLNNLGKAQYRLYAMRELMRYEMPDRISDVSTGTPPALPPVPLYLKQAPSVWRHYYRRYAFNTGWTPQHQGAECLYLILSTIRDSGDKAVLDYFTSTEIGDVDDDGMKEILDGWGQPIEFLRWAPGFTIENGAVTFQTNNQLLPEYTPDPFDPLHVDPRWSAGGTTFELRPLIFSAGRDKTFDINIEAALTYSGTVPPNDPYYTSAAPSQVGQPMDLNSNSSLEYGDNITNHYQAPP